MSRGRESGDDNERTRVGAAADFGAGERRFVEIDGREVGVFNVDGEYHALANYCPHRGGPLCEGDVVPALTGEWPGTGERIEQRATGDPSVTCPWHGWEFDVSTGTHLGDETLSVPTYDVIVEDGGVYVRG